MKKRIVVLLVILNLAVLPKLFSQNVSINSTGLSADTSAMLDVSSTTKGFLMPRMTTVQRDAIILPATGLTIFNTSLVAYQVNTGTTTSPVWSTLNSGSGSVSSVSVTSANGVSGTVATSTTTPAITLTLGDITPTSVTATGTVTGSNLSGTNTGNVTIGTANGLSLSGQALSLTTAGTSTTGALTSTDWNTFNGKAPAFNSGDLKETGSDILSITGGTGSVIGAGTTVQVKQAATAQNGFLSSSDWNTFNIKQPQLNGSGFVKATGTTISYDNSTYLTGNQTITFAPTGDVTGSTTGTTTIAPALVIGANKVLNTMLGQMPTLTIKGNNTGGTTNAADLTVTEVNAILPVFTSSLNGLVPLSGGSAGKVLHADGTWKDTASATNQWSISGNTGTTSATSFLGTTDLKSLKFKTNSIQGMILDSSGNVGIGTSPAFAVSNPEKLLVDAGSGSYNVISGKGNNANFLQLNIKNGNSGATASSDVVATNEVGTEANGINYVDMGINSSGNTSTGVLGGANTGYLYSTGSDFAIGNATAGKSLTFFTGGTGSNERMRIDSNGNVGISNTAPKEKLDVTGNIKFSGALMPNNLPGNAGDFLVSGGTGTTPLWFNATSAINTVAWSLVGNSGSTSATSFIGTTDLKSLKFKTNSVQGMILDSLGNIGVGGDPAFTSGIYREKFLVDAGNTTSYNAMVVQGSVDSFFQFNIQNLSTGIHASSDVVATSNAGTETSYFVDMGINSSTNTSGIFGRSNDAYLYNSGENFFIGASTPAKSLIFMTGGTDSATNEQMHITGAGNVGIGNGAPTQKLDVTGNIKFSGALMPGNLPGTAGNVLMSTGAGTAPTWVPGENIVTLGSDVTNNNGTANTMADVTGLSFPVTAGVTYRFNALIVYTAAATTTGSRWAINGPATSLLAYSSQYPTAATTQTFNSAVAYDFPAASNATSANTAGNIAIIEGVIKPSANGTVVVRFASEVSASAIIAKAGSSLKWW